MADKIRHMPNAQKNGIAFTGIKTRAKSKFKNRASSGGTQNSLGIKVSSTIEMIEQINAGLPYQAFEALQKATGLAPIDIAALVGISQRTLIRRKETGRLRPDESDRLVRAARVVDKAVQLFEGDRAAAMQWLQTRQPALDGREPLEFTRTEVGSREVEDLIGRLEHGVFA
jgi:putative toxin-antitoxin system antitoxin component (TIGR02293 family)